ncbi:MAG: glycosyltransferase [Cohaesibacter sp.]|nr:glycosyltransferase [Cohaesibacter sp.]
MFKPTVRDGSMSLGTTQDRVGHMDSFRRLYVVLDGTFTLKDGQPASYNMDYEFFKRYCNAFDEVVVVARLFEKDDQAARVVEGPKVRFEALPAYQGPKRFLKALPKVLARMIRIARDKNGTVLVRAPSSAGNLMGHVMMAVGRPYGIELVGDPAHAYSKDSLKHPLSPLFQWLFTKSCQFLCRRAETASYVTRETLQRDYKPGPKTRAFHYTSLDLPSEGYKEQARKAEDFTKQSHHLIQVAMMQNWYKGHDISLGMMAEFKKQGRDIHLHLIGDGPMRETFEARAKELDVTDHVHFVGQLKAGEAVWEAMDAADMLILPSRQEGLPRVVIEAMARALPVVSNNIGGASELLDHRQMIESLDVTTFTKRVSDNLDNADLLAEQSARNLRHAKRYMYPIVQKRREACYRVLKYQLTAQAQYI